MRLYFVLIFAAVTMAFMTGYYSLFIQGGHVATDEDIQQIAAIKESFQAKLDPEAIINFNALYYTRDHFQLLDPVYTVTDSGMDARIRYSSNQNCFKDFSGLLRGQNFEKVWLWEAYRCGAKGSLPRDYFSTPPYLHPSGKSFAYLAFESGRAEFKNRQWVTENLSYFHLTELSALRDTFGDLGGVFKYLARLGAEDIDALSKGQGTILTPYYLLARLRYPSLLSILEYRVYGRKSLEKFVEQTPYVLSNYDPSKECFHRDGSICWDYSVKHVFKMANKSSLAIFVGFILICGLVIRLLIVKLKQQRLEDERRRLALQVLTHEFRTPITSMLLLVERMRKKYEFFDDDLQDAFLRLSSEVYRMQRLTETSRNYLRLKKDKKKLIHFNIEEIPSFNEFLSEVVDHYMDELGDNLQVVFLEKDRGLIQDPYWLRIILKNLIENALAHGQLPIKLTSSVESEKLQVQVEDQGECLIHSLEELTSEFVKGPKSSGTGLGLNIVYKATKEMGGNLTFKQSPTTFTITIPLNIKGNKNEKNSTN